MSRRCDLSGTGVMVGNNVSHAVNRTKRRFVPNLQVIHADSEVLKRDFSFRTTTRTQRTIDAKGGLDGYLLAMPNRKLTAEARKLKRKLLKAKSAS